MFSFQTTLVRRPRYLNVRLTMKTIILLILTSFLCSEENFAFHLGYQSNAPAYVAISISNNNGKCAIGLIKAIEFKVTDQQVAQLIKLSEIISKNDKLKYGNDVKIAMSSKNGIEFMYQDALDGNERIKTYRDILGILNIDIPKEYEIPSSVKDFKSEYLGTNGGVKSEIITKKVTWLDMDKQLVSLKVTYRSPGPGFSNPQIYMVDENNNQIFSAAVVESKEIQNAVHSITFSSSLKQLQKIRFMINANTEELFIDTPISDIPAEKK
jgi:hypothetical protein